MDAFSKVTDEELMQLCKDGSEAAFTALYHRHKQPIMNFATQMTGNHEDAADVFQETFRYVFAKINTYEPRAKFSTLIYQVARNLSIDILRKRKRPAESIGQLTAPEMLTETPVEFTEKKELSAELRRAVEGISETYREILILRYGQELSYDEISEVLRIPLGTVQSRLHHAISLLRDRMVQKGVYHERK